MKLRLFLGLTAFVGLLWGIPDVVRSQTGALMNGDFSDPTGFPWAFMDTSQNGSVSYMTMEGVVTGGDDGASIDTSSFIEQPFSTIPGNTETITFDWSYSSVDPCPGFDNAFWDLIDTATMQSVVGGPVNLGDVSGVFGVVMESFTGSGSFLLRLGTQSADNVFGPGVTTFDNVVITGQPGANPFNRGDCNNDGSFNLPDAVFLLAFLFPTGAPATLDCVDACDANDDGALNLPDAVTVLNALFGMPPISLPGPLNCSSDPTMDGYDCLGFGACP